VSNLLFNQAGVKRKNSGKRLQVFRFITNLKEEEHSASESTEEEEDNLFCTEEENSDYTSDKLIFQFSSISSSEEKEEKKSSILSDCQPSVFGCDSLGNCKDSSQSKLRHGITTQNVSSSQTQK